LHVEGARIARIWCDDPDTTVVLEDSLIGEVPERLRVRARLSGRLRENTIDEISARIDSLYRGSAAV
jgi:hypothetical protein